MPVGATVFAFVHEDTPGQESVALYDVSSGSTSIVLPTTKMIRGVAISPDRTWIAYTHDDGVYAVGVDGSSPHQVSAPIPVNSGTHTTLGEPAWSPEGATVYVGLGVYSDTTVGGGTQLAAVPSAGGLLQPLGPAVDGNCAVVTGPAFSPTGSFLVAVHAVCADAQTEGLWVHAPSGAGQLAAHVDLPGITRPLVIDDTNVVAVVNNNLALVQNGAVAGGIPATSEMAFRAVTAPPDRSYLVVGEETLAGAFDLYAYDGTQFHPLTADGKSKRPSF